MSHLSRLSWVLESPNLLDDQAAPFKLARKPEPEEIRHVLTQAEVHLDHFLSERKSHFLGSYFEALWEFFLIHSPGHELLASNLQIHESGKTLGELDFLLLDRKTGHAIHQEVAVKFYLGTCIDSDHASWIGPNAIDRLDLKMSHLQDKQLPFSSHPQTKKRIIEQFGLEQLTEEVLLKGYLFHPQQTPTIPTQTYINPDHSRGLWCYTKDVETWLDENQQEATYWLELDKKNWMTNKLSQEDIQAPRLSTNELLQRSMEIEAQQRARMFCRLADGDEISGPQSRMFIVPSNWPG